MTDNSTVILKIPVTYATINHGGVEKKVVLINRGLVDVEYSDGEIHSITNPLKDWIVDQETRISDGSLTPAVVYFQFVDAGPASNPGFDDNGPSIHNDEYSTSSV